MGWGKICTGRQKNLKSHKNKWGEKDKVEMQVICLLSERLEENPKKLLEKKERRMR